MKSLLGIYNNWTLYIYTYIFKNDIKFGHTLLGRLSLHNKVYFLNYTSNLTTENVFVYAFSNCHLLSTD